MLEEPILEEPLEPSLLEPEPEPEPVLNLPAMAESSTAEVLQWLETVEGPLGEPRRGPVEGLTGAHQTAIWILFVEDECISEDLLGWTESLETLAAASGVPGCEGVRLRRCCWLPGTTTGCGCGGSGGASAACGPGQPRGRREATSPDFARADERPERRDVRARGARQVAPHPGHRSDEQRQAAAEEADAKPGAAEADQCVAGAEHPGRGVPRADCMF